MMVTAYSMVVRSAPSGAVLRTAPVSPALIFGASSPIERASSKIGTTSATTTTTSTMPMTKPSIQPKWLLPSGAIGVAETARIALMCQPPVPVTRSDGLAEVPDGLQACVDRGKPCGHRAGQLCDGRNPAGRRNEGRADGTQVEDHPQEADGGDRDNDRRDDQGEPGSCWHGGFLSVLPSRGASQPNPRSGPHRPRSR